jgi:hypothetical protein
MVRKMIRAYTTARYSDAVRHSAYGVEHCCAVPVRATRPVMHARSNRGPQQFMLQVTRRYASMLGAACTAHSVKQGALALTNVIIDSTRYTMA